MSSCPILSPASAHAQPSRNEPTFDGCRHVVERQVLVAEVVEIVVSCMACEHDRKRPVLHVVADASLVAALVEQAQLAV